MNLFSSPRLLKAFTVASVGCVALASSADQVQAQTSSAFIHRRGTSTFSGAGTQTPPTPGVQTGTQVPRPPAVEPVPSVDTIPPSTPEEARASLRINLAYQLLQSPLTLSVENLSLEKIAAKVQESLVNNHSTPRMEVRVREARPVLLSFTQKNSTVGEVLGSSGTLAGVQLWVFSDYFLLAPEKSLLPEEKAAIDSHAAGKAPSTMSEGRDWGQSHQRALSSFVANEIKGLRGGEMTPGTNTALNKVTFNQLSPESQEMLRVLFANTKAYFWQDHNLPSPIVGAIASFDLSSNPSLDVNAQMFGHNSQNDSTLEITFPGKGSMGWSTSGGGMSLSTGGSNPKSGPARPTAPFFDPSAGNS